MVSDCAAIGLVHRAVYKPDLGQRAISHQASGTCLSSGDVRYLSVEEAVLSQLWLGSAKVSTAERDCGNSRCAASMSRPADGEPVRRQNPRPYSAELADRRTGYPTATAAHGIVTPHYIRSPGSDYVYHSALRFQAFSSDIPCDCGVPSPNCRPVDWPMPWGPCWPITMQLCAACLWSILAR